MEEKYRILMNNIFGAFKLKMKLIEREKNKTCACSDNKGACS